MPIKFRCVCGKCLVAPDEAAGKKAKCPACQTVVNIPKAAPDLSQEAPSEPPPCVDVAQETPPEPEARPTDSGDAPPAAAPAEGDDGPDLDRIRALKLAAAGGFKHLTTHLERTTGARQTTVTGRALVVDGDPESLSRATDLLERHGFEVIQATNGEQAIKMAFKHKPDIVILELVLSGLNGYEVCRKLKDPATPESADYDVRTPVLIVTSKTKGRDLQYAKSLGADGLVKKPFDPLSLYRKMDKVLNR